MRKLRQGELGTLPHVLHDLLRVLDDPKSSARDLERIVTADPTLSARVLRLANSALYGLCRRIIDLRHAIALIGPGALRLIIMSTSAFDACFQRGSVSYNRSGLWRHSLRTAFLAKALAARHRGLPAESLFIAGLLHDLGMVVLDQYAHRLFVEVLSVTRMSAGTARITSLERQMIGTSHAEIGEMVTDLWHLPPLLGKTIRYHHAPEEAGEAMLPATVVAAADILVNEDEGGVPEWPPEEAKRIVSLLRLSEAERTRLLSETREELKRMEEFMKPDSASQRNAAVG